MSDKTYAASTIKSTLLALLIPLVFFFQRTEAQVTTSGTDFWMGYIDFFDNTVTVDVRISSSLAASGTVAVPGQGWSAPFNVAANATVVVAIPIGTVYVGSSETISKRAIHITSNNPVSVMASTTSPVRSETALILPTHLLGTEYFAASYSPGNFSFTSEFLVVATANGTTVDITPSSPTAGGKPANVTFSVNLNAGDVYQVKAGNSGAKDLSGSKIAVSSSTPCKAIAVFGGMHDGYVPAGCATADPLFEEMNPVNVWGTDYIVAPFYTSTGSQVRIFASKNTSVSVDGGVPFTLNAGQFNEQSFDGSAHCISATNPVQVVQYMKGNACSGASPNKGDPSMMTLNSNAQMTTQVVFSPFNASMASRSVNVVMQTANVGQLTLDGVVVGAGAFSPAPCSGYSYARINITNAFHTLAAAGGFLAYMYGYGSGDDSFSNPLGWSTSTSVPRAIVSGTDSICAGQSATLTVSGASSYTWSTGATTSSITVNPSSTTTYTVIASNGGCSNAAAAVIVKVNSCSPPPAACNLVPNPGFETGACPTAQDQVPNAIPWTRAGGSPDYFGIGCAESWTSSYFRPCSQRMVGFYTEWHPYNGQTPDYREYVQAKLTSPLVAGTKYCVSFYVRWANNMGGINTATDNLGAYFTTNAVTAPAPGNGPYNLNPQIESAKGVPINTNGWVLISGSFTATGGEQYVTVGNFHNYATTAFSNKTGNDRSYYFLDDIVVMDCNATCLLKAIVTTDKSQVCPGQCASISASGSGGNGGPYTYSWSPNIGSGAGPFTVCPSVTTVYTVTITEPNGSCTTSTTATASDTIFVSCGPTVTATGGAICLGSCLNISATGMGGTGAYTYTWMPANLNGNSVNVCPTITTTYTVLFSDANGSAASATALVTVTIPSLVTASSSSICTGQSTSLSASGANSYTWMPGGSNSNPLNAMPSVTTTYTLTGTTAGCTNSAIAIVTVNPVPVILVDPVSICVGQSANLTASGADSYTWMPGSLTGSAVTVSPASTTTYTVTGSTTAGCSSSATVVVSVNTSAAITVNPATLCLGESTILTASGATNYTWTPGGTTGNTLAITPAGSGTYTVVGITASGCSGIGTVSITVNPVPSVTVSKLLMCKDSIRTMSASGASTYTWQPGNLSGSSIILNPTSLGTITYTIIGANTFGCTQTTTAVLTVADCSVPSVVSNNPSLCSGACASLTATGVGGTAPLTYQWTPAIGTGAGSHSVCPVVTTSYTIVVTDAKGASASTVAVVTVNPLPVINASGSVICSGETGTVSASGASSYTWMPGNATNNPYTMNPPSSASYTVTGKDVNGCVNTAEATIRVNAKPIVTGSGGAICQGQSMQVSVSGANSYLWNPGASSANPYTVSPASTTTYTVTGTDVNGCSHQATVSVKVETIPMISVTSASICAGSSATLNASGAVSYTWLPVNTNGATLTASPSSSTTYTIIGATGAGCTNNTTSGITVNAAPQVVFEPDTAACSPLIVTFKNSSTGAINSTCHWDFGDGKSYSGCFPPPHSYVIPGVYSVALTLTSNGCSRTLTRPGIITVYDLPKAGFTADPKVTEIMEPKIRFTNKSLGESSRTWYFGDNTVDSIPDPTHIYEDTGHYNVCLEVRNSYGCRDSVCQTVIIKPVWAFYVPNAFTPNGDGRNDIFSGKGVNIEEFGLYIYDRWGNLLFETNNMLQGWDGKANGGNDIAQEDVYVYVVQFKDVQGIKHKLVGSVTLVK